ncbi:MAG: glycoside hydrolase family 43 protein, partial [Bacteroidaceae bacterium]|nr:glycoside hydrolase family 43 protein [Bacteroidaceae bacterium]
MKKLLLAVMALVISIAASADNYRRVSVHDPSIVIAYKNNGKITGEKSDGATKIYYIFGSHKAFARSTDLKNWTTFTNNIPTEQNSLFQSEIQWSKLGSSDYDVNGNLWAPDVIWNKDMQKWCMYMSVNGDKWYSSIALLTADSPEGNWTHVGTVVYSIPWNAKEANIAAHTDFYDIIGQESGTTIPSRYKLNRNGNQTYGLNAIDPCVFYDEDGRLWMTYGSWFGGLYMLELDKTTGLRDTSHKYEVKGGTAESAEEDPYMGIKLYGGNHVSGEASYIEYIGGKYWLFVTYGGLTAAGGYNMRAFSSDNVTGPYTDMTGRNARYTTSSQINSNLCPGTINGYVGTRFMSYYKWDWLSYAQVAQGHNSVVVDDNGKIFNVYHTRFNSGNEGHEVRVHQMFLAENGGLCAAPFEYSGETLGAKTYTAADVAGWYSVLNHGWGTDYANLKYVSPSKIQLTEDGSISGAYTGTWKLDGSNITLTIGGLEYKGVLIEQKAEDRSETVVCFTTVCQNRSLWGFKKHSEDKDFDTSSFTLGATNNSSPFWSAFSDYYTLEGDGTLEAKFVNYTAGANNWENWLLACSTDANRGATGYSEYFVQRADLWWWGTSLRWWL